MVESAAIVSTTDWAAARPRVEFIPYGGCRVIGPYRTYSGEHREGFVGQLLLVIALTPTTEGISFVELTFELFLVGSREIWVNIKISYSWRDSEG